MCYLGRKLSRKSVLVDRLTGCHGPMVRLVVRSRSHEPEKAQATDLRLLPRIGARHGKRRAAVARGCLDLPALDLGEFGCVRGHHVLDRPQRPAFTCDFDPQPAGDPLLSRDGV
jgi:hypothetical protein